MGFTLSWVRSHFPRSFVHRDFEIRTRNEDLHWVVVEQFFLETPEQNQREGEGKYLPLSYNDGGNLWTIRPHSVCSWMSCSSLFLIADGGRPSGSTAVYDGCVCDYTTYSIYKYATTTSDHVNFWFFIFLTTHDIVIEIIVFTLAKFPTRWRLLREVDNDVLLSPWTPPAVWNWLGLLFLFLQFYQKSSNRLLLICDLIITCISVGWESARPAHTRYCRSLVWEVILVPTINFASSILTDCAYSYS